MPLDPSRLYDIAEDLLASVIDRMEDVYDDYTPAISLPDRRYVHAGDVAWDCEQVVVAGRELTHAFPGQAGEMLICSPPHHYALEVWIVRCVPGSKDNGDPPTPESLDEAARVTMTDQWVLSYILWANRDDWKGTCASLLLGPVEIVGPTGNFSAVKATVFVLVT